MKLGKLRAQFEERKIDGFIIASYENRYYMSGFSGTAGILVISADDAVLITDFRYVEQAKTQAPEFRVIMHKGPIGETVKEVVTGMGLKRVGFESERMTVSEYQSMSQALEGVEMVPEKGVVELLRMIKSEDEIALIAEACRITDAAFDHILGYIKPGVTEMEIANELISFMVKHDVRPSFDFIVASGKRSALPHGVASEKAIEPGDFVTLDFGGFYRRYTSDMTRTVIVGKPTEEQKAIYELVLKAQLESIDAAKAGTTGKEVDGVARGIIEEAGHGEHFGHGLGHSAGLEIHESPRFSPSDSSLIEAGMVLSVEPGVYVPGWGGVRIEDLVAITDGDARVLSHSPKDLIQL